MAEKVDIAVKVVVSQIPDLVCGVLLDFRTNKYAYGLYLRLGLYQGEMIKLFVHQLMRFFEKPTAYISFDTLCGVRGIDATLGVCEISRHVSLHYWRLSRQK